MPAPEPTASERMNTQLLALRESVLAISADLSLGETLKRIVAAAAQLANARYAALGVPDSAGEILVEFVTYGLTAEQEARITHRPRGHGILGVILHEGQSLRLKELSQHPRSYGFPPHHPPMTSFLGVPIIHKGKRLGNLYLTDKREAEEFTPEDQRLIEFLAAHAGIAIENARLHERVQELAVVEERQRIGMDLHDGVIQSIYGVGLMLEYVNGQIAEGDNAGAHDRLKQAIDALNATIRDIRAYILDLRPRNFTGDNLLAGLQQLIAEFKANTLISVELTADGNAEAALSPEGRLALFHIAQEALNNTAKHSQASRVEVKLVGKGPEVILSIRDNGRGFKADEVDRRVGHGLRNMHDRSLSIGGAFTVGPNGEDSGIEVRVSLPKRPVV
jgi:signal transduction histidine kinase